MNEIRDRRQSSWFWMDKDILDTHGPRIGAYGIAVYALLARYADNKGHAFPSLKAMVRTLGISRQSVVRSLESLVNAGLVSKGARKSEKGAHVTNLYTLLHVSGGTSPQDLGNKSNDVDIHRGTSPQDLPTSPQDLPLRPQVDYPTSPQDPEQDLLEQDLLKEKTHTLSAPKPERYSVGFEKFWLAYPVKKEKASAWQSWKRQKLERLTDTIIESIAEHHAKDQKWQQGFVKYPATYLNNGCWMDEFDVRQELPSRPAKPCDHRGATPIAVGVRHCGKCDRRITETEFEEARGLIRSHA